MIVSQIEGSAEQLHRKKDDLSKVSGEAAGLLEDVTERMHQAGLQLNESGEAGVANVDRVSAALRRDLERDCAGGRGGNTVQR